MRLCYCYRCKTLSKIDDYTGTRPEYDGLLQDWIDRHMHGLTLDDHPGGRVWAFEVGQGVEQSPLMDMIERKAVEEVRADLAKVNQEVFEMRDEVKQDAVACHLRHGQPSWPGKPCIDYQAGAKILGRRNAPKEHRVYLCTFCPYESSVTVAKRAKRGDYRRN